MIEVGNIIEKLYKSIGQKIRSVRKITLEDLSFETNIDWSFLARIETGKAVASVATLYKISKALNIYIQDIFNNKKSIKKTDFYMDNIYSIINKLSFKEKTKILKIIKLIEK